MNIEPANIAGWTFFVARRVRTAVRVQRAFRDDVDFHNEASASASASRRGGLGRQLAASLAAHPLRLVGRASLVLVVATLTAADAALAAVRDAVAAFAVRAPVAADARLRFDVQGNSTAAVLVQVPSR